jgi:hypothetical protein
MTLAGSKNTFEVSGGAHAEFQSLLDVGHGAFLLDGGSVDVGSNFPFLPPKTNFVRVGLGGYFSSASSVKNVENWFGQVNVGSSPGLMTIHENYAQQPGGLLRFTIAGTNPVEDYSQLAVGGNLELAGTLRLAFEDGFAPQAGQTFDLITVGGTSQLGTLKFEVENLAPGFAFNFAPIPGGYRLTALTNGRAIMSSDYNSDGMVDGNDLAIWQNNFGSSEATQPGGDADYDRNVDGADFLLWQRQLGGTPAAAALTAVPEPTSAAVLLAALALSGSRRAAFLSRRILDAL